MLFLVLYCDFGHHMVVEPLGYVKDFEQVKFREVVGCEQSLVTRKREQSVGA